MSGDIISKAVALVSLPLANEQWFCPSRSLALTGVGAVAVAFGCGRW